jgi:thermitase
MIFFNIKSLIPKKVTLSIVGISIAFSWLSSFYSPISAQSVLTGEYIPSEVVIMLKDGYSETSLRSDNRISGHKLKNLGSSNLYKLELNDDKLKELGASRGEINTKLRSFNSSKYSSFIQEIKRNSAVLAIEPNYIHKPAYIPEDSMEDYAPESYSLDTDDSLDINQERTQSTGRTIKIAILDTHINGNHPILKSKILRDSNGVIGYDFIEEDSNPFSIEGKHGTMVASIAAGNPDSSTGFSGGSCQSGCVIIPVTVCAVSYCSLTAELDGINFAANNNANIINLSLGGYSNSVIEERLIEKMYREKGIVFVAAAGNNNTSSRFFPASNSHVISVGSIDDATKTKSSFSNYGSWVDISAAGTNIKGLYGSTVSVGSGTSYAAPRVAGIIGKYLLNSNILRSYQVERIIRTDGHIDFTSTPTVGMGIANYNKMIASIVNTEKVVYPVGVFLDIRTPGRPNQLKWLPFKISGGFPERYQISLKDKSGAIRLQRSYSASEMNCINIADSLNSQCGVLIPELDLYSFETDIKYFWTITGYRFVDGVERVKSLPPFPYKLKSI